MLINLFKFQHKYLGSQVYPHLGETGQIDMLQSQFMDHRNSTMISATQVSSIQLTYVLLTNLFTHTLIKNLT